MEASPKPTHQAWFGMPPGEAEKHLAEEAEPVLAFKPSSSFKRSPIGILIDVVCGVLALISMRVAGVFQVKSARRAFADNRP